MNEGMNLLGIIIYYCGCQRQRVQARWELWRVPIYGGVGLGIKINTSGEKSERVTSYEPEGGEILLSAVNDVDIVSIVDSYQENLVCCCK
jgi:hypothetical protein